MWDKLGFLQNPYDTRPLKASEEDVELLIGRDEESIDFVTALEASVSGVTIVSGVPGVGKTSFLNIQQFLLETEQKGFGPKILAARQLCPIWPDDTPGAIGIRALTSLIKSIDTYCELNEVKLPSEAKKIKKWLTNPKEGGFDIGVSILGFGGNFGRNISVPPLNDSNFENIQDIIEIISEEACRELNFRSVVICLDNIENLDDNNLIRILMTFRDTLFNLNRIWWVLIGQTGLDSLIQSLDSRVFQRIAYSNELKPISVDELKIAIDKRISKFHIGQKGNSPVSEKIYQKLYNCSNGEIRFVFKYCSGICISFIQAMRKILAKTDKSYNEKEDLYDTILGQNLIGNQIKDDKAIDYLKEIVTKEFIGFHLKQKDVEILAYIASNRQVRPKDYKSLGFKTMQDFSSNFLNRLASQNLLLRKQEGRAVKYELRGIAILANEFHLF